jgi:putative ABC transport system permease protein
MKYLLKLAIRNVSRNRRRSLLAVISVLLSVMAVVVMKGMIGGVMQSLVKNYTKNETGHIRITTKPFDERSRFNPVTDNINDAGSLIEKIKSNPEISSELNIITERIVFGVLLNNDNKNKTALAVAGDPEIEKNLLLLQNSIVSGTYLKSRHEMIMGEKLATELGFAVGDTVKVMTSGADYALHLKKIKISGLFRTGLLTLDEGMFQITSDDAKELLNITNGTQQIIIMLKEYTKADEISTMIEHCINDTALVVKSWTKIGDYYAMMKMAYNSYNMIYSIIALLGAFIIGNIMMMVVLERRKETGILKSMGFTRRDILILFMSEGLILGFIGSGAGAILGTVINIFLHFHGVDFTSMTASFGFPIDNIIHFTVDPSGIFHATLLGMVFSAGIAFFPSWKASRMNAVELIKSV